MSLPAAFSLNIAKILQSISGLFEPNPRSKFPTLIRFLYFSAHVIEQKHSSCQLVSVRLHVAPRHCSYVLRQISVPHLYMSTYCSFICLHMWTTFKTYYMKEQHSKSLLQFPIVQLHILSNTSSMFLTLQITNCSSCHIFPLKESERSPQYTTVHL